MKLFITAVLVLLQVATQTAYAQPLAAKPDSALKVNKWLLTGAGAAVYTGSMVLLSKAWYQKNDQTSFHFFNDNHEWLQLDKAGHFLTSFHESRFGVDMLRLVHTKEKNAIWWGGMLGFLLQSPIELLDGRSPAYGASVSDLAANMAGSAAVIGQYLAFDDVILSPKFSFHRTKFAMQRPNVLGKNIAEQVLKDYNGQTYWLSVPISSNERKLKWLHLAAGYGGEEMLYNDPDKNQTFGYRAYRQYYLSPDISFKNIKTNKKALKIAFYLLDIVKLPAPALGYSSRKGFTFHPVYF